ncbi:MAG: ATP-binding protein [Pseudomonadota bacterium]
MRLILVGMLSFALIVLFGILQFHDVKAGQRAVLEIEESNLRLRIVSDYLRILQDVETGQRGYVVTGNSDFLEPQLRAQRVAAEIERQLVAAYPPTSDAGPTAAALIATGKAKQVLSQRAVNLRRDQGQGAASALIATGHGQRVMDRARNLVIALERRERARAHRLFVDATVARQTQQRRILLAEALLLLSLAGLLAAMARTISALRRSSRELADSATRQSAIFAAANDAMVILDEHGVITSANAAAERLFGRRRAAMIGRSNLALFAHAPSEAVSNAYLRGIARGDGSVETTQTFIGMRDDGTTFETEVATTPVSLHDGRHFLAVARDATERRRIERLKSEFVATISHELRTPLTSIAGSLGLLTGGAAGPLPEKASRLLGIAQSNSQRLIRLINDILDIEKIEAGKMAFATQLLDLETLLERAIHDSSGLAAERSVVLTLAPVAEGSMIQADPDRMGQVLANLLSNAIKYSPVGGAVTLSTERRHPYQRISVIDHGSGIPPEFRDRMFEKFAQADSTDTRQVGGTGLGLSIVREIVTRMNGAITFESVPGERTAFHIDLRAQTQVSSDAIDTAALHPPSDSGARHLLHVDDDPDTLRLVSSAFEGHFEVRSTSSIQEAEAALRRFQFDLVILDMLISDGSGIDLVPAVHASCGDCPIILYTAYDVDAHVAAQVDGVCTKTRDGLDELVALGNRLLRPAAKTSEA